MDGTTYIREQDDENPYVWQMFRTIFRTSVAEEAFPFKFQLAHSLLIHIFCLVSKEASQKEK